MPRRPLFAVAPFAVGLLLSAAAPADAGPKDYLKEPGQWFASEEAARIGANVLSHQSDGGGWPKNVDTAAEPHRGDRGQLQGTYDNGATTDELRLLAKLYNATRDDRYREAFDRGFTYVLEGQYANGGWPQFHPPGEKYHRHITFNDDAMVRLMRFAREVAESKTYQFVDPARRQAAGNAFDRGVECILRCQIRVNGQLTAWCAQHDEVDFRPRPARTFELATLSGAESVSLTQLLMSLEDPSPEVIRAVDAAVVWFESAKLTGIREDRVQDAGSERGFNKVVVNDPDAPPLWARFYDIETNAPVFVDRDGVPRPNLADIGDERRNGYAWYGTWPEKVLGDEYQEWKQRIAADAARE
ncbi:pectate lyase [Alienimonas californiensis]|uniref:Pectic acid lyase n=1 Tax=Alienimonas californiensis TaxID=2527989 RepID=A0A517P6F8_9PLAN|nr:pectate lyase [Alienimonas californiensis]QDT14955.1 Pectic acid lyase [Alienimonas californiensis]